MATPDELFAKAKEYMGNGNTAMEERDYQKALASFSQALYISNSQIFSERAAANIMLEQYDEAVYDAIIAINFDSSNSNAYLRQGVACFYKKEYYTAKKALEAGFLLSPTDTRFPEWIDKCKSIGGVKCELTSDIVLDESSSELNKGQVYSHEWTQTKMEAVLTVHAKGIVSDHVYVSFEDHMVVVTIDDNSGNPYVYATRFINEISPQYSAYGAYTDYIEVRLAKSEHVDWILPDNSVDGECSTTAIFQDDDMEVGGEAENFGGLNRR